MKHYVLLLDHHRFKDPKMSEQRYFLVLNWKEASCTRVFPNIGKIKRFQS